MSAAQCAGNDYVRLGEWNIVDPYNYDRDNCYYYNDYSKSECENEENLSRCSVRGYTSKNANVDCFYEGEKCGPELQDIQIVREIVHPNFGKIRSQLAVNDIMLLKLSEPATFNGFVSPLCLPDM